MAKNTFGRMKTGERKKLETIFVRFFPRQETLTTKDEKWMLHHPIS
jgi:hypothetical protein